MERTLYRGDTYVVRRRVFDFELVDENLDPFPLDDCEVYATFKPEVTDPVTDPDDSDAPIKAEIIFSGAAVLSFDRLIVQPGHDVTSGRLSLVLTSAQSLTLPVGTVLHGDVRIRDALGEITTVFVSDTIKAGDAYTNRILS